MTAAKVDELFTNARHKKGDTSGTDLTIVEFADFECPSCRRAYDGTLKTIEKTLPAHRMGFYHLPLEMHPRAIPAAIASEAAAKQGKFWEMYADLFDKKSDGLDDTILNTAAKTVGLDISRFTADSKDEKSLKALIEGDMKVAIDNSVNSTPTFFIHDKVGNVAVLSGAVNLARFLPDLKNGVIGDDSIAPPDPKNGAVVTLYINGKQESR